MMQGAPNNRNSPDINHQSQSESKTSAPSSTHNNSATIVQPISTTSGTQTTVAHATESTHHCADEQEASTTRPKQGSDVKRSSSVKRSTTISDLKIRKRWSGHQSYPTELSPGSEGGAGLLSPTDQRFHVRRATSVVSRSSSHSDRSTSSRHPPASCSSNGIETTHGPPPALMTNRKPHHSDLARFAQNPAASALAAQQQKPYNKTTAPIEEKTRKTAQLGSTKTPSGRLQAEKRTYYTVHGLLSPMTGASRSMESLDAIMNRGRSSWHHEVPADLLGNAPQQSQSHEALSSDGGLASSQSSEDQFLKLANESQTQKLHDEPAEQSNSDNRDASPEPYVAAQSRRRNSSPFESEALNRFANQTSRAGYKSGAASVVGVPTRAHSVFLPEQKVASSRIKYNGPQTPQQQHETPAASSQRRASTSEQLLARFQQQRQTRLNHISPTDSEFAPKSRNHTQHDQRTDGESVVSTVHPNVWDEMQELKSHINRLEQNRGYASGRANSNGSGERPRTATTTITTVSSSPKVSAGYRSGLTEAKLRPEIASMHPNLHQSLARCRPLVSPAVFRALDSAAAEALEMAATSRTTTNGSMYGPMTTINGDRQSRRKADNICRSLTDLCVALIDGHGTQESPKRVSSQAYSQRRQSRDFSTPVARQVSETAAQRLASHQQQLEATENRSDEGRPSSSRALERVQARRASLMIGTPASSPREPSHSITQSANDFQDQSKLSPSFASAIRTGTSLQRHRVQQQHLVNSDRQQPFRPPSRAATEIGIGSRGKSDRTASFLNTNPTGTRHSQFINTQHASARHGHSAQPSPSTPSSTMSFLRTAGRNLVNDKLSTGDTEAAEEKKAKRRSFNLYSLSRTSTTPHRPLSLRPASISSKSTSVTADS